MEIMGGGASGTTYVTFDDVKVPVENLIGKEGEAFKYIMYNFLHERMTIVSRARRSPSLHFD
jgi:alkylation response protein AidB-like acyl-CoA dehydrogenase